MPATATATAPSILSRVKSLFAAKDKQVLSRQQLAHAIASGRAIDKEQEEQAASIIATSGVTFEQFQCEVQQAAERQAKVAAVAEIPTLEANRSHLVKARDAALGKVQARRQKRKSEEDVDAAMLAEHERGIQAIDSRLLQAVPARLELLRNPLPEVASALAPLEAQRASAAQRIHAVEFRQRDARAMLTHRERELKSIQDSGGYQPNRKRDIAAAEEAIARAQEQIATLAEDLAEAKAAYQRIDAEITSKQLAALQVA